MIRVIVSVSGGLGLMRNGSHDVNSIYPKVNLFFEHASFKIIFVFSDKIRHDQKDQTPFI